MRQYVCHILFLTMTWGFCVSQDCIGDQISTYLCNGHCMIATDPDGMSGRIFYKYNHLNELIKII